MGRGCLHICPARLKDSRSFFKTTDPRGDESWVKKGLELVKWEGNRAVFSTQSLFVLLIDKILCKRGRQGYHKCSSGLDDLVEDGLSHQEEWTEARQRCQSHG